MTTESTARAKVWLERDGKPILGRGRARLLQEIDRTGSIRRAATNLGLSYRHAWGMVGKMSEASGKLVVNSSRGGKGGGRSALTRHGKELLDMYLQAEAGKVEGGTVTMADEIRCTVVSVNESGGLVTLHSASEAGEIIVTVKGSSLPKKMSVGDEVILLLH